MKRMHCRSSATLMQGRSLRRSLSLSLRLFFSLSSGLSFGAAAQPTDPVINVVIHHNRFDPATLHLAAGARATLVVENQDGSAEEFESHTLNREKVIPAGARATLIVGPLPPGTYHFFGDYHPDSAQGTLVVE